MNALRLGTGWNARPVDAATGRSYPVGEVVPAAGRGRVEVAGE
jgi:hypothetical protein